VVEFLAPEEMQKKFPDFKIDAGPTDGSELLEICKRIIKYSVKTGKYLHLTTFDFNWGLKF